MICKSTVPEEDGLVLDIRQSPTRNPFGRFELSPSTNLSNPGPVCDPQYQTLVLRTSKIRLDGYQARIFCEDHWRLPWTWMRCSERHRMEICSTHLASFK
eukprot:scaffold946_cov359-Pavlova_lutheri.AAC.10